MAARRSDAIVGGSVTRFGEAPAQHLEPAVYHDSNRGPGALDHRESVVLAVTDVSRIAILGFNPAVLQVAVRP